MKIQAFVSQEVEVDIEFCEVIYQLLGDCQCRDVQETMRALSSLCGFFKHIPDEIIKGFGSENRKLVEQALLGQAKRWGGEGES